MRKTVIFTLGLALLSTSAFAQIYSWRDDNGNLVVSDKSRDGAVTLVTYPVAESTTIRSTRPVSVERSSLYDSVLIEHARLNNIRVDLVRAVVQVESAFNPLARSPKGALGLMQLMPATAREFGVKNPFNPVDNIRAGVAYLRRLLDRYQNNEILALAAYNAGPAAVDTYGQNIPPYRETQRYVALVNQISGSAPVVTRIYKVTEIIDGRVSTRYTDKKPAEGEFEVMVVTTPSNQAVHESLPKALGPEAPVASDLPPATSD